MQSPPSSLSAPCFAVDRLARRHRLARLGLAWLANMQVMMFAFPGYFLHEDTGPDNVMLLAQAVLAMNWISLALTLPVIFYCAWPVWDGVWRRRQGGGVSMDVPVALSMVAAFVPSAVATWTGHGEVYFESVTMFVAFLLTARYLEDKARRSMGRPHAALQRLRGDVSVLAQRLAFWFVLVQIALAVVVGAVWFIWKPEQALPVTVALLVMSCPCAMAMAVPTALSAAYARLRRDTAMPDAAVQFLAQATGRVTRQNLYGAIAWHLLMTPLAAAGWVAPWLAAIAMLISSLAVAANSWRLYHRAVPIRTRACAAWREPLCSP